MGFKSVTLPALVVLNATKLSLLDKNSERDNLIRKIKKSWWRKWVQPVWSMMGKYELEIAALRNARTFAFNYPADEEIVVSWDIYLLIQDSVAFLDGKPKFA